ncbi:MAG: DnaJ domain-containing protein [Pseudomonadota bacterium]
MSDDYNYKPRLGYDIRVKPPRTKKRPAWDARARICEAPGCEAKAECRVSKSPTQLNEYMWYCTEHAREHNRNWNFFKDMSEAEAKAFRESAAYGHRPTWKMGAGGKDSDAARATAKGNFHDPQGLFEGEAPSEPAGTMRGGRKLTKLQISSFKTLDLDVNTADAEIRARYTELLKRYHPDSNGGERGAEERLQEVLKAYRILKKAGFCT